MLFLKVAIYVIYLVILRSRAIYMPELDSYYDDYIATAYIVQFQQLSLLAFIAEISTLNNKIMH